MSKSQGFKYYANLLLKGGAAVSLGEIGSKIIGFLLLPVFTYYLSPQDYGIVSLTFLIVTLLNLFYNPGILSASVRLYHSKNDENERREYIGSALIYFLFIPLSVSLLILIFRKEFFSFVFPNLDFFPYGLIAIFIAFFTQVKRLWIALMTLIYKVEITALYSFLSITIGLLVSLFLVIVFDMGALGRILGAVPPAIFLFIIGFKTLINFSGNRWSWKKIKYLLRFGSPLIIAIWSYEILYVADRFIIERMLGIAALGIYTFAYTIGEAQKFLLVGIKKMWSPIFYENMNKKNFTVIKGLISFYIIFLVQINLFMILFSKEIIIILVNERFYDSIPLLSLIIVGLFFNGLIMIFSSSLAYKNKFASISKIALIASILNIILNILLIPIYGLIGAALATLLSYFIYFLIGTFIERETIFKFTDMKLLIYSIIYIIASSLVVLQFDFLEIKIYEILIKVSIFIIFSIMLIFFKFINIKELIKNFKFLVSIKKNSN